VKTIVDVLTFGRQCRTVSDEETLPPTAIAEPSQAKPASSFLATDIKVSGHPLDPAMMGKIIKPRELVDIVELKGLRHGFAIHALTAGVPINCQSAFKRDPFLGLIGVE
jgi:hypothetical protein